MDLVVYDYVSCLINLVSCNVWKMKSKCCVRDGGKLGLRASLRLNMDFCGKHVGGVFTVMITCVFNVVHVDVIMLIFGDTRVV